MTERKTVLVLGAYGLAGREVVRGLIEKTGVDVTAAGRDAGKLAALEAALASPRVRTRVLDASEQSALATACEQAAVVVNCVGPYTEHGAGIAAQVVGARRGYVDFANEQSHYRRLQLLDAEARRCQVPMVTAAGAIPGVSTLLVALAARRLGSLESARLYFAQGRMPDAEVGLASLMSGILESGLGSVTLREGRQVPLRLGDERRSEQLPAPFGPTVMFGFPTTDELVVPSRIALRSLSTYWDMGEVPPGFLALVRLLRPHRSRLGYRLVRSLMEWGMRHDYRRAVSRGLGPDAMIRAVGHAGGKRWEGLAWFRDGAVATAFLAVTAAARIAEGTDVGYGLLTVLDLFDPEQTAAEMVEGGWARSFEERTLADDA